MFKKLFALGAIVALIGTACAPAAGDSAQPGQEQKLRIVATTTIVGDIVRSVAGDAVEVTVLLAPGVDPHEYEPVPGDVRAVSQAALVFLNGAGLEPWLDGLLESAGGETDLVALSDGLALRALEEDGLVETDPHVWLDVANAIHFAERARDALIAADPSKADTYRGSAEVTIRQLSDLDTWLMAQVDGLPAESRLLVTNHDTFGYFAARYGFTVVGTAFPTGGAQASPSAREIADLIAAIKASGVKAVFTETTLNPDLANTIGQEAGVKVVSGLYTDSLGPADSPAATYIGMMRHDVQAIVEALR